MDESFREASPTEGVTASGPPRPLAEPGPYSILTAALFAALATWLVQEGVRAYTLATEPLAHPAGPLDVAHTALGGLAVSLTFGALLASWRLVCLGGVRLVPHGRGPTWLVDALLSVSLPGLLLGWFVTAGTRLGRPFTPAWWAVVAAILLGGPPALWLLRRVADLARRGVRAAPVVAHVLVVALAAGAALLWVVGMAPHKHRYGPSHLFSFGLLTLFYYFLAGYVLTARAAPQRARPAPLRRRVVVAWAVLFVGAVTAVALPPSPAAVELFFAGGVSKWVGRAVQGLLPDGDGDGASRGFGLFVGRDCDDSDPRVGPGQPEVIGNGRDENCFAGDLTQAPAAFLSPQTPAPAGEVRQSSVLLIVIDGWRYDHGSLGGVDPERMPRVARLAAEGTVFEDYRVCAPRTRESLGDILGGSLSGAQVAPGHSQAIGALTEAGVHTISVTSRWLRRYRLVDGWTEERFVDGRYGHFNDGEVVAEALAFLDDAPEEPFFLFIHLLSAHEPYEGDLSCAAPEGDSHGRYDCALAAADGHIGELLAALDRDGLLERTVVAVTADHGEEFLEHGSRFHASTVFDEVLHVPLVIRAPTPRVARIEAPANCFDVVSTLASAARLPLALPLFGRDLWRQAPSADGTQYARTRTTDEPDLFEPATRAVAWHDAKLIFDRTTGLVRFHDLQADPGEQHPLASLEPALQDALTQRMDAWLSEMARAAQDSHRELVTRWLHRQQELGRAETTRAARASLPLLLVR